MAEYRILLLEDSELDAGLLMRYLSSVQLPGTIRIATSREEFEAAFQETWDCIVSDFNVPGFGAIPALQWLHERGLDVPFIIVSGEIGEENAVQALREGADDFIGKANLARLGPAIERAVRESLVRKREVELRDAHEQAVKEREKLLAVIRHDLQNPLAAIRLASESLCSSGVQDLVLRDETVQQKLVRIRRSAARIDHLIRDVLDKAKMESGQFSIELSTTNLFQFWKQIEDTFVPLAKEKNLELKFTFPSPDATLTFDETGIFRVASNLLSNALKFAPPNSEVQARMEVQDGVVRCSVQDWGPGIPEKDISRVFSKFYQSHAKSKHGSGLGLYIVQEIVRLHGGKTGVESKPGSSTTFWFTLPTNQTDVAAVTSNTGRCVMIVDDDEDLRSVMRLALEERKINILEAGTVTEAQSVLSRTPRRPDVVVVDYDLPGSPGIELIRELNQQSIPPQMVLMSAHPEIHFRASHLAIPFVIRKPMQLGRFLSVIDEAMTRAQSPS